jgi:hypothetical protein
MCNLYAGGVLEGYLLMTVLGSMVFFLQIIIMMNISVSLLGVMAIYAIFTTRYSSNNVTGIHMEREKCIIVPRYPFEVQKSHRRP